jgi:glutamine synthetase
VVIPLPQGPYYTGVGYKNVGNVAREIVEKHIDLCLDAGINIEGINAEVAKGQWEFQIFGKGSKSAADQMWVARYILTAPVREVRHRHRMALQADPRAVQRPARLERLRHALELLDQVHMREVGGKEYFEKLMAAFNKHMDEHIAVYGPENHLRLTGLHETQSIDKFTYGIADRGSSIRVPHSFVKAGYKRLPRGSPAEFGRRPVPGRRSDPEDHSDGELMAEA